MSTSVEGVVEMISQMSLIFGGRLGVSRWEMNAGRLERRWGGGEERRRLRSMLEEEVEEERRWRLRSLSLSLSLAMIGGGDSEP